LCSIASSALKIPHLECCAFGTIHGFHRHRIHFVNVKLSSQDHPQIAWPVLRLQFLHDILRRLDHPSPEEGIWGWPGSTHQKKILGRAVKL